MTFTELKAELAARGFTHLDDTRRGLLINRSRARLDTMYPWPYREASGEGVAPVEVADLALVEAVTNETTQVPLEAASYQDLVDWYGDLSIAGSPVFWYRAFVDGTPIIATYPTNSDIIGVQYYLRTPSLSLAASTPLAPDDYHYLIVDMAQQIAERERGNFEASQTIQIDIDRQVNEMVEDLLAQQGSRFARNTDSSVDD